MFKKLYDLNVIEGIVSYLEDNTNKAKDGILHLGCGKGEFAEILANSGFTKYHGTSNQPEEIKEAKALVPAFKTRFHKMDEPLSSAALKHKHDIIISLGPIDFGAIPSGQRLIVVTESDSYDNCCFGLSRLFQKGASTIQHESHFVTYGVRA